MRDGPVSFAGTATDPSSVDQGSLTYTWEFADGTPTGTATGTDVSHTLTLPGVYVVTLTVCDKDGGCSAATRRLTVGSKQPTLLVNFSDIIGRNGSSSSSGRSWSTRTCDRSWAELSPSSSAPRR